ncbi:MAG: glucosidase [Microcystis aeruginosa WS75]|nr:glucosidase [Microcystis aeruginosa WS75]
MLTIQDTQKDNPFVEARKQTEEYKRLQEVREQNIPWKKWGPYLSDRQWATVREDYSQDGNAWRYFNYDQSRSRAYRWGEDGILGISDERQRLCFALTLWNENDELWNEKDEHSEKHLKERFFGLTGFDSCPNQGNHMEDVKEYYFYLDNNPTHSYMKALYKYPYEFPYKKLIQENNKRRKDKPEYELIDTNCFDEGYFDVVVEYAKKTPEDILIKITVWNRGSEAHPLHILPTLWFRNTWSWLGDAEREKQKPSLQRVLEKTGNNMVIKAHHGELGDYYLYCQGDTPLLFTENETNNERIFHTPNASQYVKDGINNYVVNQELDKVNPEQKGTKAAAHYNLTIEADADKPQVIWLRLTDVAPDQLPDANPFGSDFEEVFDKRKKETDAFYQAITPSDFPISDEERQVQRQAFAGMLWNKQFYYYIVQDWLKGDWSYQDRKWHKIYPPRKTSEHIRNNDRNKKWTHLHGEDIISMPDKWEYPYFCVWDSAFHAITLALIDPDFAKEQILLFTQSWYSKDDGQIPSCEFGFDEVNPPILAWAALKVDEIEHDIYGSPCDQKFLQSIFDNLQKTLDWWLKNNRLPKQSGETKDKYVFRAGFLGLDNISIVDRNQFLTQETVTIEQIDATSWVAMFYLNMFKIVTKLDVEKQKERENYAKDFLKNFILIVHEINEIVDKEQVAFWDSNDNFYYEVLKISLEKFSLELPLKYRSILGIVPLFTVETFRKETETDLTRNLRASFYNPESCFAGFRNEEKFKYLLGEEECVYIRSDLDLHEHLDLFLSIVNKKKLQNIIDKLLDEKEFLSDYGVRSLSKFHEEHPYQLDGMIKIVWHPENKLNPDAQPFPIEMKYEPAETKTPVHTGNSNWRGPVWFPMNFLIIESLKKFYEYFNVCLKEEDFGVLCPSVSHHKISLEEVSIELSKKLIKIFLLDKSGKRPVYGDNPKLRQLFKTPDGQDLILFYEYFHGDTGQGLGASHQTGWTGLVANLIYQVGEYNYLNSAPS